jgi:hypothetical protein
MFEPSAFDWRSLHIGEASLIVAILASIATLIISWMALQAARSANQISEGSLKEAKTATQLAAESLRQAKTVAERELADWRQSKWFELYFRASEMCDTLDHFQKMHPQDAKEYRYSEPLNSDYNNFMFLNRKCLTMAVVFPKNDAVDKLAAAAAAFKEWEEVFSAERLKAIEAAVQDIRELALLHPEVLLPPEMLEEIKKQMTGKFEGVPSDAEH